MTTSPTTSRSHPAHTFVRSIKLGAATVAAAAILVLPGTASASAQGAGSNDLGPRIELVCARVPNLQERTDNVLARIHGDATVRGSLAWLQAQIDDAEAKGRTQLVTFLQNRLEVRTARAEILEQRKVRLVALAERCAELHAPS
jgi:hypothetical protein